MDVYLGITVPLAVIAVIVAFGCRKMRREESRRAQDVAVVAGVNAREVFTAEDNYLFWTKVMRVAIVVSVLSLAVTILILF